MCNFYVEYDWGSGGLLPEIFFKNLLSKIESVGNFSYKSLLVLINDCSIRLTDCSIRVY